MAKDDDITIDFSKIKNRLSKWFRGKERHSNTHPSPEEKATKKNDADADLIAIDYSKIGDFLAKHWHYLALLCVIIFVVYMRMQASYAPVTENWAKNTVYNSITAQIRAEIDKQNPNLPDANKQALISQRVNDFVKLRQADINAAVADLSIQYKKAISYTYNGKEYVFLGDIDSYYWLRYARNILEHGNICDEIRRGECFDKLSLAPLGRKDLANIHPYAIATVYKASRFLGIDIPLMQASMLTPTVIAVLVAIAAFFVGYLLVGRVSGIITAIVLSCNPMYVNRSLGSDNDIYNLLMPLVILTFLFMAIKSKEWKSRTLFAAIAGFFQGFFKFAWSSGWWNIFNAIIYAFIGYIAFLIIYELYSTNFTKFRLNNRILVNTVVILAVFYLVGMLSFFATVTLTEERSYSDYFSATIDGPLSFLKFQKAATNVNIWPNVLTTVAEFNPIALSSIPGQLFIGDYSRAWFFLGIFGIMLFFFMQASSSRDRYVLLAITAAAAMVLSSGISLDRLSNTVYFGLLAILSFWYLGYIIINRIELNEERQHHLLAGIILTIWFIGTMIAATKGIRFTMLVVPSMAIAIGTCLEIFYISISKFVEESYSSNKIRRIINSIILVVIFLLPISIASDSLNTSKTFIPNYNAAWDSSLTKIRENSMPDAIVNSWWDFGHWFKYTTERGVTLDGATQGTPPLHWLGKLLLTDNETVSRGILRMLDCSSNNAFDVIVNTTKDTPMAVDVLNKIIVMEDHAEIRKVLSIYGIPTDDQERILKYSHCDPPENYLITSDDMIGKAGVWAHFGSWNFYKAEVAAMELLGASKSEILSNLTSRKYRNSSEADANNMYNDLIRLYSDEQINAWIAPWPGYSGESSCTRNGTNGTEYLCDNGFRFDDKNKECYAVTAEGKKHPQVCIFVQGDDVARRDYADNLTTLQGRAIGVAFYPSGKDTITALIADPPLATSMFTRLFFMKGHGLSNFDLFDYQQSPLGTRIFTWKVDWTGKDKQVVFNTASDSIALVAVK